MDESLNKTAPLLFELQRHALQELASTMRGQQSPFELWQDWSKRSVSAMRYSAMVRDIGGGAFGAARLAGEKELASDDIFRLVYLPAKEECAQGAALFHLGGVLPYGDPLFRFVPGTCFFERFTERGLSVYALELLPNPERLPLRSLGLEALVDRIEHFARVAFEHNRRRRMILEGYCGLGPQALVYLCARPEDAAAKFDTLALFVSPVDGRRCGVLAEMMARMPQGLIELSFALAKSAGLVGGDALRLTQDFALGALWAKSSMGMALQGWQRPELAELRAMGEAQAKVTKELAGAYWISAENARRFPVPLEIARFSARQFKEGVGEDGTLPASYRGEPLSLRALAERTDIEVFSFYGGEDRLVPQETAWPLQSLLGERYHHVVHQGLGHVGYILSPRVWQAGERKSLSPNPIELVLASKAAREETPKQDPAEGESEAEDRIRDED
ncbi:MAG: hypothetical protein RBU37_04110 [Myxococcota bacterium]|nr:hypothetical protein [Myxococcota bacterium]